MERGSYVSPYRSKKMSVYFKGERTRHVITHNPSTAKPGEILHVEVPRLEKELIVPGTLALSFDMVISPDQDADGNALSTFLVNNLAASIVSRYVVKIGSEIIFDLNYSYLYNAYKDMWLTNSTRENAVFRGIQNLHLRKTRTGLTTDVTHESEDQVINDIFKNRYSIPLDFEVISQHMPLSSGLHVVFELTINAKEYVLNYETKDSTSADFNMSNLRLEYETIEDESLQRQVNDALTSGVSYLFDHIHHYKRELVQKDDDRIFVEVGGIDRKSMKGILLIFEDDFDSGRRNSDRFPNPRIENINLTIDSLPNKLYTCGYKEENQWEEICRHFMQEDFKQSQDTHINLKSYYGGNKFAVWTDLRSTEDNLLHGSGKVQKAANKIMLEMKKKKQGEGRYYMHVFIVSDARIVLENKKLRFDL